MAFASAVSEISVFGNKRIVWGTYTNTGGSTGGDIATGLNKVDTIKLQPTGAAVVASAPSVNETLPLSSGDVTIVNTANEVGQWVAFGD
jgi:hypothetical protein